MKNVQNNFFDETKEIGKKCDKNVVKKLKNGSEILNFDKYVKNVYKKKCMIKEIKF